MRRFYLLFVALIVLVATSCKKIQDPQFRRLENFKVKQVGLQGTTIGFNVTFYNPNNFTVAVKEAACDIYIDSIYAGKFTQDQPVDVGRETEFSIPLSGNVPFQAALKMDFSKLINRDIFFKANGDVKIGKAGIFVTRPFNYTGTHQIKM